MRMKKRFWFRIIVLMAILVMAGMSSIASAVIIIENGKIPAPGGEVRIPIIRDGGGGSGMSGYDFIVTLSDPSVAEIKDAVFPQWASLTTKGVSGPGSLRVSAVDLTNQVRGTDSNVPLLTLIVRGKTPGSSMVNLNIKKIDDDSGNPIDKDYTPGIIMVGGEIVTEQPTILPQVAPQAETTPIAFAQLSPTPVATPQETIPSITETQLQITEINFTAPLISNTTPLPTVNSTTSQVLSNPEPANTTPGFTPTPPETIQIVETMNISTNTTEIEKTQSNPMVENTPPAEPFSISGIFPFSLLLSNNTPQIEVTQVLPNISATTVPTASNETIKVQVTNSTTQPDNEVKGQFILNSVPAQAEVYIGGRFNGVTPLQVPDVKPGIYEITMKLEGYEDVKFSAVANPGKITQVPLVVMKQKNMNNSGLIVSSLPPDADIYLNDMYFGRTPITLKDLPAGKTRILLKKSGFRDATHDITLIAGVTSRVSDIPLYPL